MFESGGAWLRGKPGPVLAHDRSVIWADTAAAGLGDGSTATDPIAAAYDDPATYITADQDDVLIYKSGNYDFLGSVAGLTVDVAGFEILGYGFGQTTFVNSNVAATRVISCTVNGMIFSSFGINESTATVEGIYIVNTGSTCIHDIFFSNTMENGITYLDPSNQCLIWDCWFNIVTDDGIECTGSGCKIWNCHFSDIGGIPIHLNGNNADYAMVFDNKIAGGGASDYGIVIALGDDNIICNNFIGGCVTGLRTDTGTDNAWDGNIGTFESDWTTAVDGLVQDIFGTAAAHRYPLNASGMVRLYPDLVNMAAGDIVEIIVYRMNDGVNSRQATSITYNGAQTDLAPVLEFRYTETRTLYITLQRTAGVIVALPVGIEEGGNI